MTSDSLFQLPGFAVARTRIKRGTLEGDGVDHKLPVPKAPAWPEVEFQNEADFKAWEVLLAYVLAHGRSSPRSTGWEDEYKRFRDVWTATSYFRRRRGEDTSDPLGTAVRLLDTQMAKPSVNLLSHCEDPSMHPDAFCKRFLGVQHYGYIADTDKDSLIKDDDPRSMLQSAILARSMAENDEKDTEYWHPLASVLKADRDTLDAATEAVRQATTGLDASLANKSRPVQMLEQLLQRGKAALHRSQVAMVLAQLTSGAVNADGGTDSEANRKGQDVSSDASQSQMAVASAALGEAEPEAAESISLSSDAQQIANSLDNYTISALALQVECNGRSILTALTQSLAFNEIHVGSTMSDTEMSFVGPARPPPGYRDD